MANNRIARPSGFRSRDSWNEAYEKSFDAAWRQWTRGDWLVALVYASHANDARLARAMLEFARERLDGTHDEDAALAVLEVAEATLAGRIDNDVCERIADNLREEALEAAMRDHRLDRYFGTHCISAAARLAAHVRDPSSAQDAIDVIRAAVSQAAVRDPGLDPDTIRRQAAARIRDAIPTP